MTHLSIICSAVYFTFCVFIALRAKQKTNVILAACCGVTSAWAASSVVPTPTTLPGLTGLLDILRIACWYGYLLFLYRQTAIAPRWQMQSFGIIGGLIPALSFAYFLSGSAETSYSLLSLPTLLQLILLICELLLIENLYFNLPEINRWHISIPCALLSGVACLDIILVADAALYHRVSVALTITRLTGFITITPLLALSVFRNQRWHQPVRLSRIAVFHSATLVLSGSVLLALALAGKILRRFDDEFGWIAELTLVFSGSLGLLVLVSSKSVRSAMQRTITKHFFADRYDYRFQWLQCISTLSGIHSNESLSLSARAIRVVADVVDSPSGALLLLEEQAGTLTWQASWNMSVPHTTQFNATSLVQKVLERAVIDFRVDRSTIEDCKTLKEFGPLWLCVPLIHMAEAIGVVFIGPPRMSFDLDQEVFDLLQILGREIGAYIAESRAAESVLQTRALNDYGKRFAFVAHDIKNVSSQLAMLVQNAEIHLSNPLFQADMVQTVQASVSKIGRLLSRLNEHTPSRSGHSETTIILLQIFAADYQRDRNTRLILRHDGVESHTSLEAEVLQTILTHLVNNAIEADPVFPIEVSLKHDQLNILIEITDHGSGMDADFIRDELFAPFKTSKPAGSGIGAYQARELLKDAGGRLIVESRKGLGTTMRVVLPRTPVFERNMNSNDLVRVQHV